MLPKLADALNAVLLHRKQMAVDIEEMLADHPPSQVLASMPGIEVRTGARILFGVGDSTAPSTTANEPRAKAQRRCRNNDFRLTTGTQWADVSSTTTGRVAAATSIASLAGLGPIALTRTTISTPTLEELATPAAAVLAFLFAGTQSIPAFRAGHRSARSVTCLHVRSPGTASPSLRWRRERPRTERS